MRPVSDEGSWSVTASGTVAGELWLSHQGDAFPEEGWRDLPVPVVAWWLQGLLGLTNGGATAELLFMEGPAAVTVSTVSASVGVARPTWDGEEEHVWDGVSIRETLLAVASLGRRLATWCEEAGRLGTDVQDLRRLVERAEIQQAAANGTPSGVEG